MDLTDFREINIAAYNKAKWSSFGFLKEFSNAFSGLSCYLFNYKGEFVLCFAGTNGVQDAINDLVMLNSSLPKQAKQGLKVFQEVVKEYPNLIVTGHSLGGSVAQYIGSNTGVQTVCFSPFGTGLFNRGKDLNVTNYGMESDIVYMSNLENQIGKTYLIENPKNKHHFVSNGKINYEMLANKTLILENHSAGHFLEEYNSFSKAVLLNKDILNKLIIQQYCRKGYIQK